MSFLSDQSETASSAPNAAASNQPRDDSVVDVPKPTSMDSKHPSTKETLYTLKCRKIPDRYAYNIQVFRGGDDIAKDKNWTVTDRSTNAAAKSLNATLNQKSEQNRGVIARKDFEKILKEWIESEGEESRWEGRSIKGTKHGFKRRNKKEAFSGAQEPFARIAVTEPATETIEGDPTTTDRSSVM